MRKSEMSKRQLRERQIISEVLESAGWIRSEQHKLFDEGFWTFFEVNMSYRNNDLYLLFRFEASKESIYFSFDKPFVSSLTLHIKCLNNLGELLKAIVSIQDTLTLQNYKQQLDAIVKVCPEIYAAVGEDEKLVKIVADSD